MPAATDSKSESDSSAAGAASASKWHLIDSAPKDGTEIILGVFRDDMEDPIVMNACWIDREERGGMWSEWHGMPAPTHWMPLRRPNAEDDAAPATAAAASAMLAALEHARAEIHNPGAFRFAAQSANGRHDIEDYLSGAIAAAKAAGIKAQS